MPLPNQGRNIRAARLNKTMLAEAKAKLAVVLAELADTKAKLAAAKARIAAAKARGVEDKQYIALCERVIDDYREAAQA